MSATNGTLAHSLSEARDQARLARLRLFRAQAESETRLLEGFAGPGFAFSPYLDPFRFSWASGVGTWLPPGLGGRSQDRRHGTNRPFIWTESHLEWMRARAAVLEAENDIAKGVLRHLTNYTVKTGYTWEASPTDPTDGASVALAKQVQAVVDEFNEINLCGQWERDQFYWSRVDGESIVRLFAQPDGTTWLRPVESCQLRQPPGTGPEWEGGWRSKPGDLLRPDEFAVIYQADRPDDVEYVPAEDIAFLPLNVRRTVKRGLSDFYSSGDSLHQVRDLLNTLEVVAEIQARVPWIEQYNGLTRTGLLAAIAQRRALNLPTQPGGDPISGRDVSRQQFLRGEIPCVGENKEYIPQPSAGNVPNHIAVAQASLRALGNRWGMPEFLVSGDASNNNYASIFISGGPWVQSVECEQQLYLSHFKAWRWRAVRNAARAGRFRLNGHTYDEHEVERLADLHGTPPQVAISNKGEEAQVDHQDLAAGVISVEHRRAKLGVDSDKIEADLKAGQKRGQGDEAPAGPSVSDVLALQKAYTAGEVSREAAVANATLTLGLKPDDAARLFPEKPGVDLTPKKPSGPGRGGDGAGEQTALPPGFPEGLIEGKDDVDLGDPAERAELIADIFGGLFGEKALDLLKAGNADEPDEGQDRPVEEGRLLEAWNALDHPRGANGRFIPKGSAEAVGAARDAIGNVLAGKEHTPEQAEQVLQHLSILTVKQLQSLHREHGKRPVPRLRQQLVDGIKARLEAGTKKAPEAPAAAQLEPAAATGRADPQKVGAAAKALLDRITDPTITPDEIAAVEDQIKGMTRAELEATWAAMGNSYKLLPGTKGKEQVATHVSQNFGSYARSLDAGTLSGAERYHVQRDAARAAAGQGSIEDVLTQSRRNIETDPYLLPELVRDYGVSKKLPRAQQVKAVMQGLEKEARAAFDARKSRGVPGSPPAEAPATPEPARKPRAKAEKAAATPKAMSKDEVRAHVQGKLDKMDDSSEPLYIPDLVRETGASVEDVHAALKDLYRSGNAMFHSPASAGDHPEADRERFLPNAAERAAGIETSDFAFVSPRESRPATGSGQRVDQPAAGAKGGVAPAHDPAAVRADFHALNKVNPQTGLTPAIPDVIDQLKAKHPSLTDEAAHNLLRDMAARDEITLQAWGGHGGELTSTTGHAVERFPTLARSGGRGTQVYSHALPRNVPSALAAPAAPAAPHAPQKVVDTFHRLNQQSGGNNFVPIADLHDALGSASLADTHAAINDLRKAGVLTGQTTDREGDPRHRAAAIDEPREGKYGTQFTHVALRPEWKEALAAHLAKRKTTEGLTPAVQARYAELRERYGDGARSILDAARRLLEGLA